MQTQAEADITNGRQRPARRRARLRQSARRSSPTPKAKGVKVIDYDRLTQGGAPTAIYVSFDNVKVGKLIGQGFIDCVTAWKVSKPNVLVMHGDPTDNNARLFAQGYNGVLQPKFDSGDYVKVGEPAGHVDARRSPPPRSQQQYTAHRTSTRSVTPNDDNANAMIAYLQTSTDPGRRRSRRPARTRRSTGLQNILKGYQCGTVYKPITWRPRPRWRSRSTCGPARIRRPALVNGTTKDTKPNTDVPSVLLNPNGSRPTNMASTVVKDKLVPVDQLCAGKTAEACTAAGIRLTAAERSRANRARRRPERRPTGACS